jgi:hypothetical protein
MVIHVVHGALAKFCEYKVEYENDMQIAENTINKDLRYFILTPLFSGIILAMPHQSSSQCRKKTAHFGASSWILKANSIPQFIPDKEREDV